MAAATEAIVALRPTRKRILQTTLLAWFAIIGFDLLMNVGLIARLNNWDQPGFLSPSKMFLYIPLGYAAFLLWCVLLAWLIVLTGNVGFRRGLVFGAKFGVLLGAAGFLGEASIFSFGPIMLLAWALDKALTCALAGAVIGGGLAAPRVRPVAFRVAAFFVCCVLAVAVMLALGVVPAARHLHGSRVGIGWDPNR